MTCGLRDAQILYIKRDFFEKWTEFNFNNYWDIERRKNELQT